MATILITGANRGIGLELVRQFLARGDTVIAACRSASRELDATGAEVFEGLDVTSDDCLAALAGAYLAWLGIQGLRARPANGDSEPEVVGTAGAARDGFLIVFLNPKIAVFFIALFSQVVGPDTGLAARLGYAATAMVIDAGWYLLVAWLFSTRSLLPKLQAIGELARGRLAAGLLEAEDLGQVVLDRLAEHV